MCVYLNVLPWVSVPHSLTYTADESVEKGCLVEIRVRSRKTFGIVTDVSETPSDQSFAYLPIEKVVYPQPVIDETGIKVIHWLCRYYACTSSVAIETALPSLLRQGKPFPVYCSLQVTSQEPVFRKNSKLQISAYEWIKAHPLIPWTYFSKQFPNQISAVKQLIAKGYVERIPYDPMAEKETDEGVSIALTQEQEKICCRLQEALQAKEHSTHLLWGVTGSGKTEVYHHLIQEAKRLGRQTLYLVPEIMLSEQALNKLKKRLSRQSIRVAVWHCRLSDSDKLYVWQQAMLGKIDVILGTRSAIFVPLKDLGLVIVDEEHEPSYKQSDSPRYHGRDLAVYRAYVANTLCVLGSATPSVESWSNAKLGKYALHTLKERPTGVQLPKVHLVDMRYERPNFEGSFILSNLLQEKIRQRLDNREQCLLFLNRRGYAPYLYCPKCEKRLECPHCHSHLVFHRADNTLRCHLCDLKIPAYEHCQLCKTPLKLSCGLGTQRIEACLNRYYKTARILRLDSDVIQQHPTWYASILAHRYDIIVGTQMLAKGLDFPNLTLVGVIQADGQMTSDDFRAGERCFQLLVQVSGRAGRGKKAGEVVVQSFSPEAPCIRYGVQQDVSAFLEEEYGLRAQYNFPPFRHMIRHIFRSRSEKILHYSVQAWFQSLKAQSSLSFEILGPSVPSQDKVNGYYRMHLLYLSSNILGAIPVLQALRKNFKQPSNVIDLWDVDPLDFR